MISLDVQNLSDRKRLYRRDQLIQLAERVCSGEKVSEEVEISVVFCDDPFIQELNGRYRQKPEPTDVLSFQQETLGAVGVRVLGDVVISLETVERRCAGERDAMRDEIMLLFCHGLLHLLGATHAKAADKKAMQEKQARYLNSTFDSAWH